MLVHRLRRWPSIAPWLSRRPVSAGNISISCLLPGGPAAPAALNRCCFGVGPAL